MRHFNINISAERYARSADSKPLVRDNNDYTVQFVFNPDSGFTESGTKTAVFVTARGKQTREFTGTTCVVPMLEAEDGTHISIGVVEGLIHTTSPAHLVIIDSITTNAGDDVDAINPDSPLADTVALTDRVKVMLTASGATKSATLAQILALGGGGSSDALFTVTYNVTTWAQLTTAIADGKVIAFTDGEGGYGIMDNYSNEGGAGFAQFSIVHYEDYSTVWAELDSSLGWGELVAGGLVSPNSVVITSKYTKPDGGIPKSDLASGVQTSLGKADTALQAASLNPYRTASDQDVIDAAQNTAIASKAETYLVTVTGQGNTYWITDRTMAQLNAAGAAGKILRAKFPITFNNSTVTVEAPLVPLLSSGTPTGYMAYFTLTSGTHLFVYTFVQGGDNQADITTQDMSSDSTPAALGTATAGVSVKYARADHVHPLPSASDIGAYVKPLGGIPASDLASGVIPSVPSASSATPSMDGTASAGSSTDYARADHVHPSDTSRQSTANLVTSLSSSSTDTQYPSAKCVYDLVGDIETLLAAI